MTRRKRWLWRALERELTPLQRETLIACVVQGRRCSDVARERGVNRSTVWRTVQRAKARLRRALEDRNLQTVSRSFIKSSVI